MENLILYIILSANGLFVSISCCCLYRFYRKQKHIKNLQNSIKNVIEDIDEIEIDTPVKPSSELRQKYVEELIQQYNNKYPFISIKKIIEKYNRFQNVEDIKNIKKDLGY